MKKIRLFHGTSINNVDSIKKEGIKAIWEGVYLTDSLESATRWVGFKLATQGEKFVAVIEVEVNNDEKLVEGNDHSQFMVDIFGVGKSILSLKSIPKSRIKKVHYFKIGG
jgi:hypothetical protein